MPVPETPIVIVEYSAGYGHDVQVRLRLYLPWPCDGPVKGQVNRTGHVGDPFSQDDLLVGIGDVDGQAHQRLGARIEGNVGHGLGAAPTGYRRPPVVLCRALRAATGCTVSPYL